MRLFKKKQIKIPDIHKTEIDAFYADISIEDISLYQKYFNEIIELVDVSNYTLWSMSKPYNRVKVEIEDELIYEFLVRAQDDGLSGALLQNMINQYFFADPIQRERDKANWISRVIHRKETDYFPDGQRLRSIMEMIS